MIAPATPVPIANPPALAPVRPLHVVWVLACVVGGLALVYFTKQVFMAPVGIIAGASLAWWLLGGRQYGLARLGLGRPASAWSTAAGVLVLLVVTWLVTQFVAGLVVPIWGPPDNRVLTSMIGHPLRIAALLLVNWTSAAFGEEIVFRGFLIPAIAGWLGGKGVAWALAIVASSLLFAGVHAYQGITGMVMTGTAGTIFALGFVVGKRNLWRTVLAHGIFNTVALGFLFRANG